MSALLETQGMLLLYAAQVMPPGVADRMTTVCVWFMLLAVVALLAAVGIMYKRLGGLARIAQARSAELRRMLDGLPAFVFYKDRENNLLRVNRLFAEALKKDRSELDGRNCAEIFPDEAEAYREDDRQVIASGEPKRAIIEPMLTETGKIWVRIDKIPTRDHGGTVTGLIGFAIDVTEEIKATAELKDQVGRNNALVRALGEIVYERDIDANTIEWHGAMRDTLGLDPDDGPLTPDAWLARIHPDDRARAAARIAAAIEDRTGFKTEYRLKHGDGHYIWISDRGVTRIRPASSRPTLIGVMEDVGYRKHYEEMITAYTDKLEQSNKELHQFAYVASHDLQEPLRKIISFGDLLTARSGDALDKEAKMCVDRMQRSATRMRAFIQDLLQYSRVQSRRRPAERVDLNDVAKAVIASLDLQIAECGAILDIDDLCAVEADPLQMHQLLQNLLSNALKYRTEGQTPLVSVRTRRLAGGMAELTVSDNGIGFDPKFTDRIFAPFQRLHSRSEYEGTGMGLAVCRRIVEGHGGTITAKSRQGEGATFVVTLPAP